MSFRDAEDLTGMPKKTHRGRRSRGKGKHPPKAAEHHSALNAAMDSGDHATAKKSALHLANALHAHLKKSAAPDPAQDTAPSMTGGLPAPAAPKPSPMGGGMGGGLMMGPPPRGVQV